MATIRVDDEIYAWLKSQATPFEDTPNSVLRRVAGLDKETSMAIDRPTGANLNGRAGDSVLPANLTGKYLAKLWNVDVVHALYHRDGTWFNHLRDFPGALFDTRGYVLFQTPSEYENSPYLHHGVQLNVPHGIASMPTYRREK
jgi:hypothetical protein